VICFAHPTQIEKALLTHYLPPFEFSVHNDMHLQRLHKLITPFISPYT